MNALLESNLPINQVGLVSVRKKVLLGTNVSGKAGESRTCGRVGSALVGLEALTGLRGVGGQGCAVGRGQSEESPEPREEDGPELANSLTSHNNEAAVCARESGGCWFWIRTADGERDEGTTRLYFAETKSFSSSAHLHRPALPPSSSQAQLGPRRTLKLKLNSNNVSIRSELGPL